MSIAGGRPTAPFSGTFFLPGCSPCPTLSSQNHFLMDFLTPTHYRSPSPRLCLRGPKLRLSIPTFSLTIAVPDMKTGHPKV